MIHLTTVAGGRVEHLVRVGQVVHTGELIARVHPVKGPSEDIIAPLNALMAQQRFKREPAPQFAHILGLTRIVLASTAGRVRWIATMGPVGLTSLVALIETPEGCVRPHRAGASGFVGRHFAQPGDQIEADTPLIELRGEEL